MAVDLVLITYVLPPIRSRQVFCIKEIVDIRRYYRGQMTPLRFTKRII